MKKLLIVLTGLALLVCGCAERAYTEEEIREIARVIKVCEENGGKSKVSMGGRRYCEMPDASVVR